MRSTRLHPLAAAIALALSGPATAATLTVDNSTCDLSSAIIAANTDTATGGCPAGSGADTLNLTAPLFTKATADDNFNGPTAYPLIASVITIDGDPDGDGTGTVVERSSAPGTPGFRVLIVGFGGDLTLKRVTLRNGRSPFGAGLLSYGGSVKLIDSTVSGNDSTGGNYSGDGALAILGDFQNGDDKLLTLSHSTVSGNTGTAINCAAFADCTVRNSTISGNSGTAIHQGDSYVGLEVIDSTLSRNGGDGIAAGGYRAGSPRVTHSTLSDNGGWGIKMVRGGVSLINSTVSGNGRGGIYDGISNYCGARIVNSTIAGNHGVGLDMSSCDFYSDRDPLFMRNTLIARNLGGDCNLISYPDDWPYDKPSRAGNLIGDGSCDAAKLGGLIGDAKLGPLKDNGGRTFTHALLKGSPAINAGADCEALDQRGSKRPQGAACDIGAYEVTMSVAPVIRPIVTFFDEAVEAQTLVGTLRPTNQWHRLQGVRHQLLLAGDFNRQGSKTNTCKQTGSTLVRIDADGGTPDNNDYVTGPAAPELTARLTALRTDLGCR